MSLTTAYNRVGETLIGQNPAENWDDLAGGKVDFSGNGGTSCELDPNRALIEMEYRVKSYGCRDITDVWNENVSCAENRLGYMDFASGHIEYTYSLLHMKTAHVNGITTLYHHAISHETGHTLGLRDGDGTCPDSIMHSIHHGCSVDREWIRSSR